MRDSFDTTDTIFAPSTAIGGAIVVLRVSGSRAADVMRALIGRELKPRMLCYAPLHDGDTLLDDAMAAWFPGPGSYTGEDMLELHCHGGIQTVRRVSEALLALGLRPAEGGEFTKRAFLNGKMDLTQAEAVMDLINAQADSSMRAALHQLNGGIGRMLEAVESRLLDARSAVEAAIDYPDETEKDVYAALPEQIAGAIREIDGLLERSQQGRFLREGIRVVILGRPNVGKSSLFNALLGEDRAIVTNIAGTTRDVLDERVAWDGVSVRLMDTAGLREAADEAESIGVDRARQALRYADLLLVVLDGGAGVTDGDRALLAETDGMRRIVLSNKADLGVVPAEQVISCKTGEGIAELKKRIVSVAEPERMDTTCITNLRHIRALENARESLRRAVAQTEPDCIATDLREASHHLGTITGTDVDERLLDRIFENFCVGK
ncbi:MAG: tRNA uridine-5-carboxymethylaminomethyl(34) synthesis GTPase MnmE [Clostridia bacterium]|nr:tRNA uridine-5-carboxymethylaminomethyl(34) synthesis GTPase MnmE [Clostridia bacterium]